MQVKGMKPIDLVNAAGVTKSAVSQWLNDQTKTMDGKNLVAVARVLDVTESWLISGHGPMRTHSVADENGAYITNLASIPFKSDQVPVISWVQAGDWAETADPFPPGQADEWVMCPVSHGKHTFVLKVRGASMEPDYRDGEWIFVDPDRQPNSGDDVVVRLDDEGEATFKRLIIEGDNQYLLAVNPGWPNRIIQINGAATVVGVVIFSGKPR